MPSTKPRLAPTSVLRRLDSSLAKAGKMGDVAPFLLALREAAMAHGGISGVAKRAGLNRANLHEALAGRANPRLTTVLSVLDSLGYRLVVEKTTEGDP